MPLFLYVGPVAGVVSRGAWVPAPAAGADRPFSAPRVPDDGKYPAALTTGEGAPVGFTREDYSMQGYASAVEWYGDYIYLAASTVLQVYYAPPGAVPQLMHELELRDWVREMAVAGDALFVAARGDGLFAFDLAGDPSRPMLADRVSGVFDAGAFGAVEAVFNGVDAAGGRVAAARANNVAKGRGGVDALVFDYDPATGKLALVEAIGTDVRAKTAIETPLTVGLTEDGGGLYIGYGVIVGELAYVPLGAAGGQVLHGDFGAAFDIKTKGDGAFVANTALRPGEDASMLSRVRIVDGQLVEEPILTNPGSGAGMAVDLHGDLLCFATWTPGRYEEGYNLWTFTDLLADQPTRAGAAGTPDWIFQIACRDSATGPDWVYVADEWGGLEMWANSGGNLTLDLQRHRVATGALSEGLWVEGSRVFAVKRGAGLWAFDESDPRGERPVVEWIDRSDPGCSCADCCPPAQGVFPYPPAVFVTAGISTQGRVAVLAADRNTGVEGDGYFMFFKEDRVSGEYECVFSEPVEAWGGSVLKAYRQELIFASTASHALRVYQHCPGRTDQVRLISEIGMPTSLANMEITDVAVYGDYLFVAEVHHPPLTVPDSGQVHAFRWKQGELATCPARPEPPDVAYLGSFGGDVIAYRLALDPVRGLLIVGASAKATFPVKGGALLFYDLVHFDPDDPAGMDQHRTVATPAEADRVTRPNIHDLLLDEDYLYVVDRDNGLYRYSLDEGAYVGFYPAHRGPESQAFVPQPVRSPEGIVPLYHPVSAAMLPSGSVVVHEHNSGRATILAVPSDAVSVFLPLAFKGH